MHSPNSIFDLEDKLLLGNNAIRIFKNHTKKLYDKIKVIVVKRGPRDVFILNKYIWSQRQYCAPMAMEVDEFCKYYKRMRESEIKTDTSKVLRDRFEDLIYNYDNELKKYLYDFPYELDSNVKDKVEFE